MAGAFGGAEIIWGAWRTGGIIFRGAGGAACGAAAVTGGPAGAGEAGLAGAFGGRTGA
jgi:hypothetical protein